MHFSNSKPTLSVTLLLPLAIEYTRAENSIVLSAVNNCNVEMNCHGSYLLSDAMVQWSLTSFHAVTLTESMVLCFPNLFYNFFIRFNGKLVLTSPAC